MINKTVDTQWLKDAMSDFSNQYGDVALGEVIEAWMVENMGKVYEVAPKVEDYE
jgi:hypothetical protein